MEKFNGKYYGYLFATLLTTSCYTQTVKADFIGVYAGFGAWNHSQQGQLNHLGTDADMQSDFGFEDDTSNFVFIAIEHPLPLIPNVRISQYGLETEGTKTVTASSEFSFAGTAYTNGTAIATSLRLDEEDVVFYYEFLDNIVSFDLGLGAKQFDAEISVTAGGVSSILKVEETLPIAYAMIGFMIPGTGFSISADKTQTFAGDAEIVQTNTRLSYETSFLLGIEVGYRTSTVNLNNYSTIDAQLDFTGPFANLLIHF